MTNFTRATIGIQRDDGEFAILATLNNDDGHISHVQFACMVRDLTRSLATVTGEPVRAYERKDAPDYVELDGSERLHFPEDNAKPDNDAAPTVTVSRTALRNVLDYLQENEADHYDEIVSEYPDTAHEHIYKSVLDIEQELETKSRRRS